MVINNPSRLAFSEVEIVGIAIQPISATPPQNHLAILYIDESNNPKLLHINITGKLINNSPSNDFYWLDLGDTFDELNKNILAAHVMKVILANAESTFHYGFDTETKIIDPETGEFKKSMGGIGLTCATFVLEVFESCGMPLIKWKSWKKNQNSAIIWQRHMFEQYIRIPEIPKEVIERQQKNVGNRRYMPEEVAAATQLVRPATRKEVKPSAKKIRDFLVNQLTA